MNLFRLCSGTVKARLSGEIKIYLFRINTHITHASDLHKYKKHDIFCTLLSPAHTWKQCQWWYSRNPPDKTTNENLTWKLDAHHLQLTATDVYRIKFRFVFRFERLHFSYAKLSFPINAADCGCAVSPSHFGEIWVGYRSKWKTM